MDVSGRKVFSAEALFQDESVSTPDGARFLDGVEKKKSIFCPAPAFSQQKSFDRKSRGNFHGKNKTHEDQMAAVDSTVKSFSSGRERRGEEIKRNENDIPPITLAISQPAFPVERAKKQTRVSDAEGGGSVPREALCLPSVPDEWRRPRRVGSISKVFILPETLRD